MVGFTYTIHLLEPVLANSLAGDSNSARSLPYIPGGLMRGAVIGRYLKDKKMKIGDATNLKFRRLFLNGKTRYLHAYPTWGSEKRALPAPLAWKKEKYAPEKSVELYNLAEIEADDLPDPDDVTLTKVDFSLWQQQEKTAVSAELNRQINVHTQRDAVLGRANVERGAVYRYEALPAGTNWQGVVLTEKQDDADYLKSLLQNSEFLLGKARAAGYGRVKITDIADLPDDAWREGWSWVDELADYDTEREEYGEAADFELPTETNQFTITFVSAGLVRDNYGQFTTDPTLALSKRLGITTEVLKNEKVFRQAEVVGGFNRHWGLPLPQTAAIAPGSVFQYRVDTAVPLSTLAKLEETGLGERRAEGFGRVVVEYEMDERIVWNKREPDDDGLSPADDLDEIAQPTAKMLLRRLLRQELDEKLLTAARNLPIKQAIPNSQLSRWRMQARNAMNEETTVQKLEHMTAFYASEKKKQSRAWQKMQRARVGRDGSRLTNWLNEVLTGKNQPWAILYDKKSPPKLPLGNIAVTVDDDLAIEYKLRLIDLVLAARMKANKKAKGGQNG